jgi:hypothetical protein
LAKITQKIWDGVIEYEDDDVAAEVCAFNETGKSTALWLYQPRELYRSSLHLMGERQTKWNETTRLLQAPIALMLGAYAIETLLQIFGTAMLSMKWLSWCVGALLASPASTQSADAISPS